MFKSFLDNLVDMNIYPPHPIPHPVAQISALSHICSCGLLTICIQVYMKIYLLCCCSHIWSLVQRKTPRCFCDLCKLFFFFFFNYWIKIQVA